MDKIIQGTLLDILSDTGVAMNIELMNLYYETKYDLHYVFLLYHIYRAIAREAGIQPNNVVTYNVRYFDAYMLLEKLKTIRDGNTLLPAQKYTIDKAITLCTGYIYGSGQSIRPQYNREIEPHTFQTVYPFRILDDVLPQFYPWVISTLFYHIIGFYEDEYSVRQYSKKLKELLTYFVMADREEVTTELSKELISDVTYHLYVAVDEIMAGGWYEEELEIDTVKHEYYVQGNFLNQRIISLLDDVLRWYGANTHVAIAYAKCIEHVYNKPTDT